MAMVNANKWRRFFEKFTDEHGHYPSHAELQAYIKRIKALPKETTHGTIHGTGATDAGASGNA